MNLMKKIFFLNKFLNWLDIWQNMNCDTYALSKETHKALVQTTHSILEYSKYCIEECEMSYILTGKIQTNFWKQDLENTGKWLAPSTIFLQDNS